MSVFVEIKSLNLSHTIQYPVVIQIESQSSTLQTPNIYLRNKQNLHWTFLSGIQENKVNFKVIGQFNHRQTILAYGQLKFNSFRYSLQAKFLKKVYLRRQNRQGGFMDLIISYSPYFNYIGQIQFIDLPESSSLETMSIKSKHSKNFWEASSSGEYSNLQKNKNNNEMQIQHEGFYSKYLQDLLCCSKQTQSNKNQVVQYY